MLLYSASSEDLFHPAENYAFFPTGIPASEAALCAEMSRLAYCRFERDPAAKEMVRSALAGIGFRVADANFFAVSKAKAYLATSERVAVLAFRGTEASNPTDLLTDFDAGQDKWARGGLVHEGFRDAILQVWPLIEPELRGTPGRLLFTGHSLGAALATLAASLHRPAGLHTIGSPRVGDRTFTETLAGLAAERYVDCCDIVCQVPLREMGFEHYGNFFYIDEQGAITPHPGDADVGADQRRARWRYLWKYAWKWNSVRWRRLADHAPINYVSALMGLRENQAD
jgi:pimeloyl-ACP methyl ester carboxylesterase